MKDSQRKLLSEVSQSQARGLIENFLGDLRSGALILDLENAVIDANPAAQRLLDRTLDSMRGLPLHTISGAAVDLKDVVMSPGQFPAAQTLATAKPTFDLIMGVHIPEIGRRWLNIDTYPLMRGAHLDGAFCLFDDATTVVEDARFAELSGEVGRLVMSVVPDGEPLQQLCATLVEFGPYPLAWIGVETGVRSRVAVAYAAASNTELEDGPLLWAAPAAEGEGPTAWAIETGRSQMSGDLQDGRVHERWRVISSELGLRSSVAIPFQLDERRAVITIFSDHTYGFTPHKIRELEGIMREAEFGLAHAHALDRVARALDGTLAALGKMTEMRDPYTAGHQGSVGRLGASIARTMGLDHATVELIRQSGEVHDIGKIVIPAEILTRPGKLSDLEYRMVKGHAEVGAEILAKADLPHPIAEVAWQHHERLNGSGYPRGLVGDEIILPARIIAVADVVEAMTQARPYRPARGLEAALDEISGHAGPLYDSSVVEACVRVFDSGFEFPESG